MDLYGHRQERYHIELLDLADTIVGELDGVRDNAGQLDFNVNTAIRGSGTLNLVTTGPIDWLTHRVRVSYLLDDLDPIPLITAIPRAPVEAHTDQGTTVDLELFDKTTILAEDQFPGAYGVDAGAHIIDTVRAIIASTGEPASSLVAPTSTAVLARPMVWDAGTTKHRIINDLLDAGGFFAIHTDGWGRYRADDYVAAGHRAVAWEFTDDHRGLYLPTWRRDRDTVGVPNRYVCVGRTDGDTDEEALTAVAVDIDPTSPFSYPSRQRWITRTDTDVEASSQTVLDSIAARRLTDAQGVHETIEISTPWLPIGINDVVTFTHARLDSPRRAIVQKQTVKLEVGGLWTTTLRSTR